MYWGGKRRGARRWTSCLTSCWGVAVRPRGTSFRTGYHVCIRAGCLNLDPLSRVSSCRWAAWRTEVSPLDASPRVYEPCSRLRQASDARAPDRLGRDTCTLNSVWHETPGPCALSDPPRYLKPPKCSPCPHHLERPKPAPQRPSGCFGPIALSDQRDASFQPGNSTFTKHVLGCHLHSVSSPRDASLARIHEVEFAGLGLGI